MSEDDFVNPFGDPAALRSNASSAVPASDNTVVTTGLGDYNPFDKGGRNLSGQISAVPPAPPPYPEYDVQRITTTELERRQRELEAKADELNRREQEQNSRNLPVSDLVNNWPPLPSCFPCKPCFYQDIDLEINGDHVKLVRWGYRLWIAYTLLLALNFIGSFLIFVGSSNTSGGSQFGVSIILLVVCVPASYVCWFRALYKAFKNNSSFNFFLFFFVFGFQIGVLAFQALGISGWGTCGLLVGLSIIKSEPAIGGITLVIAIAFTALMVAGVFFFRKVHNLYRNTGASFTKAREELSRNIATDPTVRSATVEAGLFAAHHAVGPSSSTFGR